MVLFVMLSKEILTFKSVDEIFKCDHLNESSPAGLSNDTLCFSLLFK